MTAERGTLDVTEHHPAADEAMRWVTHLMMGDYEQWAMYSEAFSSSSLAGNLLGEVCSETMNRLERGDPVSDRYLLGLAWTLRDMEPKD